VERLDLLQLHGPAIGELTSDVRRAGRPEGAGLVRAAGLNSFDPAVVEHAIGLPASTW
jgi:diketogulonate reductase-like aldo/keto reductase